MAAGRSGPTDVREDRGRRHCRDASPVGAARGNGRRIARDPDGLRYQDMEPLLRARGPMAG